MLRSDPWGIQAALVILLASLLVLPPEAAAQAPGGPSPAAAPQASPNLAPQAPAPTPLSVEALTIYILEGQNEIHDIRVPATATPVVEVRDENMLPVQGADVTFQLPPTGPSGTFAGQQLTFKTKTNDQGQASATFMPNSITGRFTIAVTAQSGNRAGRANITQSNAMRAGISQPKQGLLKFAWWKVGVLAGVGALVAILVTRGGGSGSSPTLIPGTPTFGAP